MDENKDLALNEKIEDAESKKDKNSNIEFPAIDFKLDSLTLSKSNIINILEDLRIIKKRFSHIENILKEVERAQYRPSKDLPGIVGNFDGEFMVTPEGEKIEVPKNYAAKSLLVYGDELKKMVDEEGKEAFKILNKVPRRKIEGLLSKKDGRYVVLADNATYNLSKNAVEFRNIKQGEWVLAVIPETGPTGNFAAIDKVIVKEKAKDVKFFEPKHKDQKHNHQKPQTQQPKPQMNEQPKSQTPEQPKPQSQAPQQSKPQSQAPQQSKPHPIQPQAPKQSPMPKIEFSDEDLI